MRMTFIMFIIGSVILLVVTAADIYLFLLIVRALKKYINSQDVRKEKTETRKSLGEVLKKYRTDDKMTQEFVAESLGVSRQAVSKWEQGISLLLLEMFPELLDRTFLYPRDIRAGNSDLSGNFPLGVFFTVI